MFLKTEKERIMANQEAITPEDHKRAAAVARTLMRMSYKPLDQSKKGWPAQPAQSADLSESDELLKKEKPPKE